MNQTDNIERANKITGWRRDWDIGDVPQRRHYETWLRKQPPADVKPHLPADAGLFWLETQPLDAIAALIRAIDDARKPKGDGLPPGPWTARESAGSDYHYVHDPVGCTVCTGPKGLDTHRNSGERIAAYIARCGSQPVRDILAACDDEELARCAVLFAKWRLPNFRVEDLDGIRAMLTIEMRPR